MGLIQGMVPTLTSIAVILSFITAFLPTATVQAFRSSTTTTTTEFFLLPHRINQSQEQISRLHTAPLLSEMVSMSTSSLKGSTSDENASSSLSSPSIVDIIITKIGSTTSMVVAGTFFMVLCYERDALMVSFFLGAIGNAIFGKVLKKLLKIERPDLVLADGDTNNVNSGVENVIPEIDRPSDNGMPSSHAMSLGFICTFVALLRPSTTIPLLAYAAISLIYRVRVNLHSVDQIAVGAVLGIFDGTVWWYLCIKGLYGVKILELVSSSGMMNENGHLSWYLLAIPALVGAAVVGSVERRLGNYFRSGSSDEEVISKQE